LDNFVISKPGAALQDVCSRVFQLLNYQIYQLLNFSPLLSSFVPVVDDGANLGAELFLHASHDGVLLGTATAAGPGIEPLAAILFFLWS
jgi:hypothetical protein